MTTSTAPNGEQTKPKTARTNIVRCIHINPHPKGDLGRSFEAEFRAAWLDHLFIPWSGSDLDDRHHSFSSRHPETVRTYKMHGELESKDAMLRIFRQALNEDVPVHIIDACYGADALIMSALEQLQALDVCAERNTRLTFLLFPSDQMVGMDGLFDILDYAGDRVDYLIVHNPAKTRGDLMEHCSFREASLKLGAREITLPRMTPATAFAIQGAQQRAKRGVAFGELSRAQAGHLSPLCLQELQRAMQTMFRQYSAVAHLLLPPKLIPCAKRNAIPGI
jgi:hypothetical protein